MPSVTYKNTTCQKQTASVQTRSASCHRKKIAFVVTYIPPWYNAQQNRSMYSYINDVVILTLKTKYENPMILIGGDFNRREIKEATRDYPEIGPIRTGPTRGDAALDIFASNFNNLLIDQGTLDPLETDHGVESDHRAVFCRFRMPRVPTYTIQKYSYIHVDSKDIAKFGSWLKDQLWLRVVNSGTTTEMVEKLHEILEGGVNISFKKKKLGLKRAASCLG